MEKAKLPHTEGQGNKRQVWCLYDDQQWGCMSKVSQKRQQCESIKHNQARKGKQIFSPGYKKQPRAPAGSSHQGLSSIHPWRVSWGDASRNRLASHQQSPGQGLTAGTGAKKQRMGKAKVGLTSREAHLGSRVCTIETWTERAGEIRATW